MKGIRKNMKFTMKSKVHLADIDVNNIVKPSSLVRYLNEAGDYNMIHCRPTYEEFVANDQAFVTTRFSIEIFEQMGKYEEFEIDTWISKLKAASTHRSYCIRQGEKIVARAVATWAVVSPKTEKIYKTKDIDLSNYNIYEEPSLSLKERFRVDKDSDLKKVGERIVMPMDIDLNYHMNNTNYHDILYNYIPDVLDKTLTSINIRFVSEAAFNSKIDIFMKKSQFEQNEDERAEEMYTFVTKKALGAIDEDGNPIEDSVNVEVQYGLKHLSRK